MTNNHTYIIFEDSTRFALLVVLRLKNEIDEKMVFWPKNHENRWILIITSTKEQHDCTK